MALCSSIVSGAHTWGYHTKTLGHVFQMCNPGPPSSPYDCYHGITLVYCQTVVSQEHEDPDPLPTVC